MIQVEHIIDKKKSLLTIRFTHSVLKHLKANFGDHINILQSPYKINYLTILKADTGYKITRVINNHKLYEVNIKDAVIGLGEFNPILCTHFLKKNGFINVVIK